MTEYLVAWYYLIHEEENQFIKNFSRSSSGDTYDMELTTQLDDAKVFKTKRQRDNFSRKWKSSGLLNHCYWLEL